MQVYPPPHPPTPNRTPQKKLNRHLLRNHTHYCSVPFNFLVQLGQAEIENI